MRRVVVVYEDRAQPGTGFGLHKLVVRSVYERMGAACEYHELLKVLTGTPLGGNGKVVNHVKRADGNTASGQAMVVVLDRDEARPLLRANAGCLTSLRTAVREIHEKPHAVFLDRNTETLIGVIRDTRCLDVPPRVFERALMKKDLDARDIVLGKAAGEGDHLRELRETISVQMRSFDYLVTKLVGLVGP